MTEQLSNTETDGNVETFTFPPIISSFIHSFILNKKYNTYEGLNEDIFLRELISNSNDSLHTIRRCFLTYPSLYDSFNKDLYIKIILNEVNHTLTIIDNGIGMKKTHLINYLGKISKVNDADWETLKNHTPPSCIPIIIGFHSVYFVADKITVITKKLNEKQYLWESNTHKSYIIRYDNSEPLLEHGTKVVLHIRKDQFEYLEESRIREIVKKYYRCVEYPIKLIIQKECKKKLRNPTKKSKKEIIQKKYTEVEELFLPNPVWKKNRNDDIEYREFYKFISKKSLSDYFAGDHFNSASDDGNYGALLYFPRCKPSNNVIDKYIKTIRVYADTVLMDQNYDSLVPEYLNFIKGVIYFPDLPLDFVLIAEREKIENDCRIRIVKRILEVIDTFTKHKNIYKMFYEEFRENLKTGIREDNINRYKLMQFLRYYTSASGNEMCSLKDYVSRMKSEQKYIYFIYSNNLKTFKDINTNVFVEYVKKHGFEVIYMTDTLDGWIVKHEFENNKFKSITTKNLFSEEYKLYKTIKYVLNQEVTDIVISNRFTNLPCCIVTSPEGWNFNFENYIDEIQWTIPDAEDFISKKYFEINPDHVIITKLKEMINHHPHNQYIYLLINILFETALLSYRKLKDPKKYADFIYRMIEMLAKNDFSQRSRIVNNANNETMEEIL